MDKNCTNSEPHLPHFWSSAGWKPARAEYRCPGIADPEIAKLSDDQLKMAARALEERQRAVQLARQREEALQREMDRAALAGQDRLLLAPARTTAGSCLSWMI